MLDLRLVTMECLNHWSLRQSTPFKHSDWRVVLRLCLRGYFGMRFSHRFPSFWGIEHIFEILSFLSLIDGSDISSLTKVLACLAGLRTRRLVPCWIDVWSHLV